MCFIDNAREVQGAVVLIALQRYYILKARWRALADIVGFRHFFSIYQPSWPGRLRTTPKSSPIVGKDLIDSDDWSSASRFWYGSRAFALSGFAMVVLKINSIIVGDVFDGVWG